MQQSARKYPESSGLNAAGLPAVNQLDNVKEQPVVPPSRMAPQVMQAEQMRYPQYYDHGEAPTILSLGYMFPQVGPTDPMFTSSHPNLSSVPTFWDPRSQSFISDPQSTSSQLTPNYDTYRINQPPQPELHLPPPQACSMSIIIQLKMDNWQLKLSDIPTVHSSRGWMRWFCTTQVQDSTIPSPC